jgi:hypothetical protein
MACIFRFSGGRGEIYQHDCKFLSCASTYPIPKLTKKINIVNLSSQLCFLDLSLPLDEGLCLEHGKFTVCLCNTPDFLKGYFRVKLMGISTQIQTISMKIVSNQLVEFIIRATREVTRLDIQCASMVSSDDLYSRCLPTYLHHISRSVQVDHEINGYLGPIWGKRVMQNTCICSDNKEKRKYDYQFFYSTYKEYKDKHSKLDE